MSSTEPTRKSQRARNGRKETGKTTKTSRAKSTEAMISSEQRQSLIAQYAYLRAEQRGFHGGDPVADWLESEKEVDVLLSRGGD
jgi:hypothetical protein